MPRPAVTSNRYTSTDSDVGSRALPEAIIFLYSPWIDTMKRCTPRLLGALLALAAASLLTAPPAHAQIAGFQTPVRNFPAAALRAEMVILTPETITLDGKPDRLSPGSRIHGVNNMLVLSGTLINQPLVVNYVRENTGQVHEVWILNSEEIKQKRPNSKSSSSWFRFFDSDAPAPAKAF